MEEFYRSIIKDSIDKEFKRAEILDNYPKLTKNKLTKFKSTVWEYLDVQIPEINGMIILNKVYIVRTKYNWYMLFKTYEEVMGYQNIKKELRIVKDLDKFYEEKILKSIEECKNLNDFSGHNLLTKFNIQIWQYLMKKMDENKDIIIGKFKLTFDEYPYFKVTISGEVDRRKSV